MSSEQIDQKSYEMPPREGITIAHFLIVADVDRSVRFYEKVLGGRIESRGDSKGAPGYIQIANTWLIVNVGGGPTPDKPTAEQAGLQLRVTPGSRPVVSRRGFDWRARKGRE